MPARPFKHLRRLPTAFVEPPIYFITTCVEGRLPLLGNPTAAQVIRDQFTAAPKRYGWRVGRFVVMPDHLHFFCAPGGDREPANLSVFVGGVKGWAARPILAHLGRAAPLWQHEFFDRLLRSTESYERAAAYVRDNPVRAGLVPDAAQWPFGGEVETLG
jgi:REP element-mobilizing transposase RayT